LKRSLWRSNVYYTWVLKNWLTKHPPCIIREKECTCISFHYHSWHLISSSVCIVFSLGNLKGTKLNDKWQSRDTRAKKKPKGWIILRLQVWVYVCQRLHMFLLVMTIVVWRAACRCLVMLFPWSGLVSVAIHPCCSLPSLVLSTIFHVHPKWSHHKSLSSVESSPLLTSFCMTWTKCHYLHFSSLKYTFSKNGG